jgi:hypothetical protein
VHFLPLFLFLSLLLLCAVPLLVFFILLLLAFTILPFLFCCHLFLLVEGVLEAHDFVPELPKD